MGKQQGVPVTDPAILQQLNSGSSTPATQTVPVTDPAVLQQLNGAGSKKKDSSTSASSSITPPPVGAPFSASATTTAVSPFASMADSFLQAQTYTGPTGSITPPPTTLAKTPSGVQGTQVPNAFLFRNPYLSDGPVQQPVVKPAAVNKTDYAGGQYHMENGQVVAYENVDKSMSAYERSQYENAVAAEQQKADQQNAFNAAVAADNERTRILESTPGTPEYNAKMYPGVAQPVAQETPLDLSRRYYRTYLQQYDPQAVQDHDNAIAGMEAEVKEKTGTGEVMDYAKAHGYELALQKQQAQFDQRALMFVGQGATMNLDAASTALTSQYQPQMDALTQINDWPRYAQDNPQGQPAGTPIISTPEDLVKYNSLVSMVHDDPGFTQTFSQALSAGKQVASVRQAGQLYLDQYPLWKEQFNLLKESERYAADKENGPGFLYSNVVTPAIRTVASAVESLAYLPKAIGPGDEYGWTDKMYDLVSTGIDTTYPNLFPMAGSLEKYENPYTGEMEQTFEQGFLPTVTQSVTQMAIIIAGGAAPAALGATAGGLATLSTVATASALSMNEFYKSGKEAGMSEKEAQRYSLVSGVISGSFMAVNPMGVEANQLANVVERTTANYAKTLVEGGTISAARQAAMKNIVKEIAGVNIVGIGQKLSEYGVNYLSNTVTGANLDTGNNISSDMWNTVVMSTILGAGFAGYRYGKDLVANPQDNMMYREALYVAAKDPTRYREYLTDMVAKGQMTPEKLSQLEQKINLATAALDNMPDMLTPREKAQALPLMVEKGELQQKIKTSDKVFAPEYEARIAEIDKQVVDMTGVKPAEEDTTESKPSEADLFDHAMLESMQASGIELSPEDITRLDEVKKKMEKLGITPEPAMAPAENGAEIKTENDGTSQNRIQQEGDQLEHQNGDESRKAAETGSSDSDVQSGKEQQEVTTSESPEEKAAQQEQPPLAQKEIDIEKVKQQLKELPFHQMTRLSSFMERRIDAQQKEGSLTKEQADTYRSEVKTVKDARVEEVKQAAIDKIDQASQKVKMIAKKANIIGDQYVTAPDGTRVPIKSNSMLDLEKVLDKATEYLKKAVATGVDAHVAVNNWVNAIKAHPAYRNMAKDKGAEWEKEFDDKVFGAFRTAADEIKSSIKENDIVYSRTEKRMMADEEFKKTDFFKAIEEAGLGHVPQGIEIQKNEAKRIIEWHEAHGETGLDAAREMVSDKSNTLTNSSRAMLASELSGRYAELARDAATPEESAAYYRRAGEMFAEANDQVSDMGRGLRNVGRNNLELLDKLGVDAMTNVLSAADGEKIDKITKRRDVKKKLNDIAKETTDDLKGVSSPVDKIQQEIDALEQQIKTLGSKKQDNPSISEIVDVQIKSAEKELEQKRKEITQKAVDKAKAKDLVEKAQLALDEAVKKMESGETAKRSLADVLAEEAKWKIDRDGKEIIATAKMLDKLSLRFAELDGPARRQMMADMLTELSNRGKLGEKRVAEMYKDALFGQEWTAEKQQKTKELLEIIKKANDTDKALESEIKKLRDEYNENAFGKTDAELGTLRDKFYKDAQALTRQRRKIFYQAEKAKSIIENMFAPERDIWDTLNWLHKGSLLGIHSGIVNLVGNIIAVPFRGGAGAIASIADAVTTSLFRTAEKAFGKTPEVTRSHDIIAQLAGISKYGFKMGVEEVMQRSIKGIEAHGGTLDKLEVKRNVSVFDAWRDLTAKRKPLQERFIEDKIASALEATLGLHAAPIFRFMALGDALPREMGYYGRLYEMAVTTKGMKDPVDIMQFIAHPDQASRVVASDFAKKLVYQQETGLGSKLADNIQNMFSTIEKHLMEKAGEGTVNKEFARHMKGMLKLLRSTQIPFVRTPVNALSEVAYFSLPGFGFTMSAWHMARSAKLYRDALSLSGTERETKMMQSNLARNQSMSSFGKAVVAVALSNLAAALLKRGLVTGRESKDSGRRQFEWQTTKPYSMNLSAMRRLMNGDPHWDTPQSSDEWGAYDQLGTVGMAMAAYVNAMNTEGYIPGTDASLDVFGTFKGAGLSTVSKMLDMSFTKSTSALLQALTDDSGNMKQRLFANTLFSLSSIVVPNDVSALSKGSDDFMRETKTGASEDGWELYKNKMQQATFQGSKLPRKVNMWGVPTPTPDAGVNPYYNMFVSPTRADDMQSGQLGFMIYQQYSKLPDADPNKNKYIPSDPGWTLNVTRRGHPSQKVPLTPQEHEQLLIAIGNERSRMAAPYVFSKQWQTDPPDVRAKKIDRIWSAADKLGKKRFILSNDKFLAISHGLPVPVKK